MLAAYFDASGTDEKSKYVVVAGFVASVDKWVEFESDWESLLKRYGLEYAHARKLAELGDVRRDTFYLEANYLLKRTVSFAVASSVKKSDYDAVFGKNYSLTVKDAIYPLAFRVAMVSVCKHVKEIAPDDVAAFFIEKGDPNQGGAKRIFDLTKAGTEAFAGLKEDYPVGTLTIAGKKDFGGLQASDMHAYSKLKHLQSKPGSSDQQQSPALMEMLLSNMNVSHFDAEREDLQRQRTLTLQHYAKRKEFGRKKYGTKAKFRS